MAFQVTDLLEAVPLTVAANMAVPPVATDAVVGDTPIELTTGAEIVTVEDADLVLSALLVAVTVSLPAIEGAVYRPAEVIVPVVAFQVTDLSVTVPCTDAVNWTVALVLTDVLAGEMVIEVTVGVAGAAGRGRCSVDACGSDRSFRRFPGDGGVGGSALNRGGERNGAADDSGR